MQETKESNAGWQQLEHSAELKEMREEGILERSQYRHYYLKAKGGSYRSISHMKAQMGVEGISLGGEQ